jgi:hypothetical protein
MGNFKIGAAAICTTMTLVFSASAFAATVNTVGTEAECLAQDGNIMDLNGEQHCLVPVIPAEFQTEAYAGEIKGVTECSKENTRKTRIGDFCLVSLSGKVATPAVVVEEAKPTVADSLVDIAKDEAEKKAKKEVKKKLFKALTGN